MPSETNLKGFDNLGDYSYPEILEHNIVAFFDWGFLNKGGFINANIPSSGAYGGDFSRLRYVNDPRYTQGTVWESVRGNWVWESGLEYGVQPINISGVFVNNVFHPASGNSFYIDYPNGRIVFNSGIAKNSTVRVGHSYKWVNVTVVDAVPFLKRIQQRSQRVDNANFLIGSGEFGGIRDVKLQLPTVAIEVADERYEPFEIGGGQYCYNKVKFYVIAEDHPTAVRLSHAIASQMDKSIYLFDSNLMAENNAFPLDSRGSKSSNPLVYTSLIEPSSIGGYRYTDGVLHGIMNFEDATRQPVQKLTDNIHLRVVTLETNSVLTKI